MAEVAREMTNDYLANLAALGVDQIDHMPKATEHIEQIIQFIQAVDRQTIRLRVGRRRLF